MQPSIEFLPYKNIIPRSVLRTLTIALVLAVSVGSFLPGKHKGRFGTQPGHPLRSQHKLYHLLTFGSSATLCMLLAEGVDAEFTAAGAVFIWGLLIECVQYWTSISAVMEWWDVRDDFLGSIAAFGLIQVLNELERRWPHPK